MSYLPILMYHRIVDRTPDKSVDPYRIAVSTRQFKTHLRWLKLLGYRPIDLASYASGLSSGKTAPRRSLAITFDDGYREVLTLALPILREFGFPATVFAVAGRFGGSNSWDDGQIPLMTIEELRQAERGGMTVGAHTMTHPDLTTIDPAQARQEIVDSKKRLEEVLGHAVPLFAYPFGRCNEAVEAIAGEAGFLAAVATDRASPDHTRNRYRLRRVGVGPHTTLWQLLWKIQRWYPAYQDWKRRTPASREQRAASGDKS